MSSPMRNQLLGLIMSFICIMAVALMVSVAQATEVTVIENTTHESALRIGRSITVPEGTVMSGDVVTVLGGVKVLGEVTGDVVAVAGSICVEGRVRGDVVSVGGQVRLGENAVVEGEVVAVGRGVDQKPSAQVTGGVSSITIANGIRELFGRPGLFRWRVWAPAATAGYVVYLVGLYALALLVLALLPHHVANVTDAIAQDWGRSALIGILTLLFMGPLTVIIAITIIGIPVALLVWLAFFVAKILGYTAFVDFLGGRIAGPERQLNRWAQLAIGVVVLGLLRYVPVLGPIVSLIVTVVTIGAAVDTKFGTNRPWLPPRRSV